MSREVERSGAEWSGEALRQHLVAGNICVSYAQRFGFVYRPPLLFRTRSLIDYGFADQGGMASDAKGGRLVFLHPYSEDRMNMTLYHGKMDSGGVVR